MAEQKTKTVKIRITTETGDDFARLSQLFAGTNTAVERLDDNTAKLTTTLNSLNVSAARAKEALKLRETLEPNQVLLEKAEAQIVRTRQAMDSLAKKGAKEPSKFDEYNNSANLLFKQIKEIQAAMDMLKSGSGDASLLSGVLSGKSIASVTKAQRDEISAAHEEYLAFAHDRDRAEAELINNQISRQQKYQQELNTAHAAALEFVKEQDRISAEQYDKQFNNERKFRNDLNIAHGKALEFIKEEERAQAEQIDKQFEAEKKFRNELNTAHTQALEYIKELDRAQAEYYNKQFDSQNKTKADAQAKVIGSVTNPGGPGYDPMVAQQVRLAELQSNLNAAVANGAITAERAQQLYGIYAKRIIEVTQAQEKALVAEKDTGFSRNKTLQLNAAAINSFQALAAGISPAQVALMEGAQFIGAFAQESKGLSDIMQKLFTPAGLAITGVITGIGIAVLATTSRIIDMSHQIRLFDTQLKASGLKGSSSDLYATALEAVGPGLGRSEALSSTSQILRAGIGNSGASQRILQLAPNLSAITGGELSDSVTKLTDIYTKGASAVNTLDDQINFLTVSQRQQINTMARAGDQVGVYNLALSALAERTKDAAEKTETEWKKLARSVSETWDNVLEGLAAKVNNLRSTLSLGSDPGSLSGDPFVDAEISIRKNQAKPEQYGPPAPTKDQKAQIAQEEAAAIINQRAAKYIAEQADANNRLLVSLRGTNLERQRAALLIQAENEVKDHGLNTDQKEKRIEQLTAAFDAQLAAQARDAAQQAAIETSGILAMAEATKNGARAIEEANIRMKASIELLQNDQQSREQVIQRLREQADAQRELNTEQEKANLLQKTIAASFKGVALGGSADLLQKEIQRLQGLISQGGAGLVSPANSNAPIQLHPSSSYSPMTGGAPRGTVAGKIYSAAPAYGFNPAFPLAVAGIESGMGDGYEQTGSVYAHTYKGKDGKRHNSRYQGVFQTAYSGSLSDIDAQVKVGLESLRKTYDGMKKALGREPELWEVYLGHQQGVAGATALIQAAMEGGSSVGALSRFKDGDPATKIAGNTISGYKGDVSSASGFNNMWRDRFNREYAKYGNVTAGDFPVGGAANQNAAGVVTNVTNHLDALKKQLKDSQEAYAALDAVQKQFTSGQIDVAKAVKDASEITEAYNMVQKNTNLTFTEALDAVKKLSGQEGFGGLKEAIAKAKDETSLAAQELAIIQSNGFNQRAADDQIALLRKGAGLKQQFPGQDITPLLEQYKIQQQIDHEIEKQKAGYQELTSFAESLTDKLGEGLLNAFKGGEEGMKAFGDLAKSILQDILNEVLKLAVVNPIKNWLSGGNAPTLDSIFGSSGIIGNKSSNGVGLDSIFDIGKKGFDLFGGGGGSNPLSFLDNSIGPALGFAGNFAPGLVATNFGAPISAITSAGSVGAFTSEAALAGSAVAAGATPAAAGISSAGSLFGATTLSSVIPVVGAGIGLLGGLFGGLFGSKKPSLDPGFKEISNRLNSYLADQTPIGYGNDTYGSIYEGLTAPGRALNWDTQGFKSAADVDKAIQRIKQMIDAFVAFDQKLKDIADDRSDTERYIDNLTKELYKQKEVAAQLHIGTGELLADFDKAMEHIQTEFKDKWLVKLAGLTDPFAGQLEELEKQRKEALRDNTATGANIAGQINDYFDTMEKRLKEDQDMAKREAKDALEVRRLAAANENEVQRALIQFDLNAAKERISAARGSATDIVELEKVLADERLKILKDFGNQIQDALDLQRISNRPTVEQLDYYQGKYNEALSAQDVTSSIKYFQNVTGLLTQLYEGTVLEADATKEARDKLSSLGKGLGLPGFASGGSFTVPAGFGSDNVVPLFRVSSGERVSITPSTSAAGSDREMAKLILQLINSNQDVVQQLQILNTTSRDVKRQNSRVLAKAGSK